MTPALPVELPEIFIRPSDHDALSRLVGDHEAHGAAALLQHELERAQIRETDAPSNATVELYLWVHYVDGRFPTARRIQLVMPWDADIDTGRVSVLSHVGAGLIGLKEGQAIDWPDPAGALRRLTPVLIEDPEDLLA